MTTEEVKRRAELYSALAEGKTIQVKNMDGEWTDVKPEKINYISEELAFRIKPEPKYRPFKTQEECWEEMHKHPDFGWIMDNGVIRQVLKVDRDKIYYLEYGYKRTGTIYSSFEESCLSLKFTDGTPFGVREE